jgi:hypothetical protein
MMRRLFPLTLLFALGLFSGAPLARAQDEAPAEAEGGSGGQPLYGYIGTALLASVAIFAICKSSRR